MAPQEPLEKRVSSRRSVCSLACSPQVLVCTVSPARLPTNQPKRVYYPFGIGRRSKIIPIGQLIKASKNPRHSAVDPSLSQVVFDSPSMFHI